MLGLRLEGRTYQYIADKASLSRQRIQQILSPPKKTRELIVTKYGGHCCDCNIWVGESGHIHHKNTNGEDYQDQVNLVLLCPSCHLKRHKPSPKYKCLQCNQPIRHGMFCNNECYHIYHSTALICSECGGSFTILKSYAKARKDRNKLGLIFCTQICLGKHMGKAYGFAKHPENTAGSRKAGVSKYEYLFPEINARLMGGERFYTIARDLGIPKGSVTMVQCQVRGR